MAKETKLGINEYWFVALIFLAALLGPIPFLGLIIYAGVKILQYLLDVLVYLVRCFDVSEYGLNGFYNFMNRVDYFIDGVFYGAILVFLVINVVKGLSSGSSVSTSSFRMYW